MASLLIDKIYPNLTSFRESVKNKSQENSLSQQEVSPLFVCFENSFTLFLPYRWLILRDMAIYIIRRWSMLSHHVAHRQSFAAVMF